MLHKIVQGLQLDVEGAVAMSEEGRFPVWRVVQLENSGLPPYRQ